MRLIDADALIRDYVYDLDNNYVADLDDIRNMPTIDAEPVRHGRWQKDRYTLKSGEQYIMYQCSECGASFQEVGYGWPYCPECGARMDCEEDDR